jgi:hypothetical protein
METGRQSVYLQVLLMATPSVLDILLALDLSISGESRGLSDMPKFSAEVELNRPHHPV